MGRVLFAAAAASDLGSSGARTVHAVRLMSVLLLPLRPSRSCWPPLVPALLGDEWEAIVTPFQLLVVVGVCQRS